MGSSSVIFRSRTAGQLAIVSQETTRQPIQGNPTSSASASPPLRSGWLLMARSAPPVDRSVPIELGARGRPFCVLRVRANGGAPAVRRPLVLLATLSAVRLRHTRERLVCADLSGSNGSSLCENTDSLI